MLATRRTSCSVRGGSLRSRLFGLRLGNCCRQVSQSGNATAEHHEASGMATLTKALPANNTLQLQYFYTQSEVNGYSGPMFYEFQMDPASPYFPKASQLTCSRGAANCGGLNNNRWTGGIPDEAGARGRAQRPDQPLRSAERGGTGVDQLVIPQRLISAWPGYNGGASMAMPATPGAMLSTRLLPRPWRSVSRLTASASRKRPRP